MNDRITDLELKIEDKKNDIKTIILANSSDPQLVDCIMDIINDYSILQKQLLIEKIKEI